MFNFSTLKESSDLVFTSTSRFYGSQMPSFHRDSAGLFALIVWHLKPPTV